MPICPKCTSTSAWYSRDKVDITLRCLCGYHKVVSTLLIEKVEPEVEPSGVKLPSTGSNLMKTLLALKALAEANSKSIADKMSEDGSEYKPRDVASYLSILRFKGLVVQVSMRRGLTGGSIWRLNEDALELIGE